MSEVSDAFLSKVEESLVGASSELRNGRYNNSVNRCYYACFQAAIAALDLAGIRPPSSKDEWSHTYVQGKFTGLLINRRKLYRVELRDALNQLQRVREQADYRVTPVTETQATRAVSRAHTFVNAITAQVERSSDG